MGLNDALEGTRRRVPRRVGITPRRSRVRRRGGVAFQAAWIYTPGVEVTWEQTNKKLEHLFAQCTPLSNKAAKTKKNISKHVSRTELR